MEINNQSFDLVSLDKEIQELEKILIDDFDFLISELSNKYKQEHTFDQDTLLKQEEDAICNIDTLMTNTTEGNITITDYSLSIGSNVLASKTYNNNKLVFDTTPIFTWTQVPLNKTISLGEYTEILIKSNFGDIFLLNETGHYKKDTLYLEILGNYLIIDNLSLVKGVYLR